jgi:molybdopterin biosynthesis enzyme
MANKSRGTWYVSFELPPGRRMVARATETFPNEREAKQFARAKLVETSNVTAGTLNPHLPKRTVAPSQIFEWLEQADGLQVTHSGKRKLARDR